MTFKDYVISYQRGDKIVADLFDYYEVFVKGLDKRFQQYSYYNQNLVLCFLKDHADINPSMGFIKHKSFKNVKVCHCFGCGKTADVVRLHQILCKQYMDKELTEREACLEICEMFKIPAEDFEELTDEDLEKQYVRNLAKLSRLKRHYTVREFQQGLLSIREEAQGGMVDLSRVGSECIKMIATVKQLYD